MADTPPRAVVLHAHCYQPPREDPWLELVDVEPSAAPDHDWNERIDRECYARLAATEVYVAPARMDDPVPAEAVAAVAGDARSLAMTALSRELGPPPPPDAPGGLARIVNSYAWCTFDVGATLCEWLERHAPRTWAAMLAGDRASAQRLGGHGNAIAAPYHHVILPLASRRDKVTEVRWGIADFTRRFGRAPRGFWLPETAVDEETLEVLADEGIRFTVLAPHQVRNPEPSGRPLRWRSARGRELALFTYDGGLAGEVAFGGLLRDPAALAARLARWDHDPTVQATILATDGETFGHHHRGGDVTLARAIARMAARADVRVHNFSSLLEVLPPERDAELVAPSAWSCAHGVERWRSDCGCKLDPGAGTTQAWRGPLRRALTWLANEAHTVFALEAPPLFDHDPWAVRDAYGRVVALDGEPLARFVRAMLRPDRRDEPAALQRARELLELERAVLRTFTSCAWFFDDVARIEARQVLRYAARVLELSGRASRLEAGLVERLGEARSNDPRAGTAADLFVRSALPHRAIEARVAAAVAALADAVQRADTPHDPDLEALGPGGVPTRIGAFDVRVAQREHADEPRIVTLTHRRTGRQSVHQAVSLNGHHGVPRVSLRTRHRGTLGTPTLFDVRDFPEPIARALLRPFALAPFPDAPFPSFQPR
jgi:alpha-amylase/alpha-mannosidase (GH57 family)